MPEARLERTRQAYEKECEHEWIVKNYDVKKCAKCNKEKKVILEDAK